MIYQISKPHPSLAGVVKGYWTLRRCSSTGQEHIQRIVPSGLPSLDFYFDDVPQTINSNITVVDNTVLTGQLNTWYDIRVPKNLTIFSVILQPAGINQLLRQPASELFNRNISLRMLINDMADRLEDKLYTAGSFAERVRSTEQFLLEMILKSEADNNAPRIKHVMELIDRSAGRITIEMLASEACFSRKQFERVFIESIGMSPKKFLRVVRFQHAVHLRSRLQHISLTKLGYACGYFDQSHMIREFLSLTGMTPGEYFQDCEAYSDYFS